MADLIEKLKEADAGKTEQYYDGTQIFDLDEED